MKKALFLIIPLIVFSFLIVGEIKADTLILRPNGAGDETNINTQFPNSTAHWDKADEAVADEDATYIAQVTGGDNFRRDLYNLDDNVQIGTINWIKVWARMKRANGTLGFAETAIKTGGTAYNSGEWQLTTSYANYSTQYITNPQAGGAWTWAQLGLLQAGIVLKGDTVASAIATQIYVEVDYTPGDVITGILSNVSGYAWSENIGWISFNCTNNNSCAASNYGVNIDPSSGMFSGYAWSENIGWINFAPAGPYPASPNYSACLDLAGNGQTCDDLTGVNKTGGWARTLAYGGGWDGWIKLRGSNYGVDYDLQSGELSGYAWSDMVIGWISFKGVNYGVVSNVVPPPTVNPAGEIWNHCSIKEKSIPTLNWNYIDGTQASYQIQIDNSSASFPSPEVDTGEVLSSSSSYAPAYTFDWNTRYWWRVRAKNQQGAWSSWSNADDFTTSKHAYPWPDFNWSPVSHTIGEIVIFNPDISQVYGGATVSSYLWTIIQGSGRYVDGTGSASRYPHIIFSTSNNKVKLQITDSDSYSCGAGVGEGEKSITAQLPLPGYKEVPPTF